MLQNFVTVFCASSRVCDEYYYRQAFEFGAALAGEGKTIVFGGGNIGLMSRLADGALDSGGKVVGVIPEFMNNLELGHGGVEMKVVKDMHERERFMLTKAGAIVTLPGGCGTFSELFQAITWKQLGLILAPIIIVNLRGYFDAFAAQMKLAAGEKFMRDECLKLFKIVPTIESALAALIDPSDFRSDIKDFV